MGAITKTKIQGTVLGQNATDTVVKQILNKTTSVTEFHSGSVVLASGSSTVIHFPSIANASVIYLESTKSCTVTFADSQKIDLDGVAVVQVWTTKAVTNLTAVQTRSANVTFNWMAAG